VDAPQDAEGATMFEYGSHFLRSHVTVHLTFSRSTRINRGPARNESANGYGKGKFELESRAKLVLLASTLKRRVTSKGAISDA
jgi:hypothetical protein